MLQDMDYKLNKALGAVQALAAGAFGGDLGLMDPFGMSTPAAAFDAALGVSGSMVGDAGYALAGVTGVVGIGLGGGLANGVVALPPDVGVVGLAVDPAAAGSTVVALAVGVALAGNGVAGLAVDVAVTGFGVVGLAVGLGVAGPTLVALAVDVAVAGTGVVGLAIDLAAAGSTMVGLAVAAAVAGIGLGGSVDVAVAGIGLGSSVAGLVVGVSVAGMGLGGCTATVAVGGPLAGMALGGGSANVGGLIVVAFGSVGASPCCGEPTLAFLIFLHGSVSVLLAVAGLGGVVAIGLGIEEAGAGMTVDSAAGESLGSGWTASGGDLGTSGPSVPAGKGSGIATVDVLGLAGMAGGSAGLAGSVGLSMSWCAAIFGCLGTHGGNAT